MGGDGAMCTGERRAPDGACRYMRMGGYERSRGSSGRVREWLATLPFHQVVEFAGEDGGARGVAEGRRRRQQQWGNGGRRWGDGGWWTTDGRGAAGRGQAGGGAEVMETGREWGRDWVRLGHLSEIRLCCFLQRYPTSAIFSSYHCISMKDKVFSG